MSKFIVSLLVVGLMVSSASAAVLFQEDWNSGGIDPLKWDIEGLVSGGLFVYTAPGSDNALYLQSINDDQGIRSVMSFNRSQQLVATFALMHAGPVQPYLGVNGPWTGTNAPRWGQGDYPNLKWTESSLGRLEGNNQMYLREGMTAAYAGTGDPASAAFQAAFSNASHRANAIMVKVTLGVTTGSKMEWSVGNGPWTTEFDTIGLPAGQGWGSSINTVSASPTVWAYFGGFGYLFDPWSRTVIDDITIEGIPEPATMGLLALGGLISVAVNKLKTTKLWPL